MLARISQQVDKRREIGKLKRDEKPAGASGGAAGQADLPQGSASGAPRQHPGSRRGSQRQPVPGFSRDACGHRGELGNRFWQSTPDGGVTWKGLFIRSDSGQEVKAVASGRVVFADWLRGFGNLLIVDHGQGFMSLYGNNETLYKQVGETIRGGDTVATVGNSGGIPESGLYFELRHQGKPLDPLSWVTLK